MQVTDVNKPLGSVGKIANAGNRVVFEPDGGYVENIKTKEKTMLRKEGTVYKLDIWVKAKNGEDELMDVDEEEGRDQQGTFSWRAIP